LNLLVRHSEGLAQTKKTHLYPFRAFRQLLKTEARVLKNSVKRELLLMSLAVLTAFVELGTIAVDAFMYALRTISKTISGVVVASLAAVVESIYIVLDAIFQVIRTYFRASNAVVQNIYFGTLEIAMMVYHSTTLAGSAIWKGIRTVLLACFNIAKIQWTAFANVISTAVLALLLKIFQIYDGIIQSFYRGLQFVF